MDLHRFLDHTGGVLALVSLTATVAWGLLATDRLLLSPRDRLLAQGVHRATGVCALGFLLVHVTLKVADARVGPAALLPFPSGADGKGGPGDPGGPGSTDGLIGLGALAGYLMVLAAASGALRSAFAGRGHAARRWRALHACAYPAWCAAVLHGLKSGRTPAGWVTGCYALCLAAVAGALVARFVRARRRRAEAPRAVEVPVRHPAPAGGAHARRGAPAVPRPRPPYALGAPGPAARSPRHLARETSGRNR
ncbi:hypothetical protein [Streptomyces netropsis]|uniref:Ferric reductase like transmembrane component n=1 Tax=Streptomyces netropsis TaxID=55404 RepID=A0A7W7L643_STRNE|nr:hypothetical protein [Streptomyces netropsis]MBB4884304.1 hypothetical protein [Streptomyces netropsis]GGR04620.1 hypothetical protein GCM10010219_06130 [Streptomyces netropsis]